MRLQVLSIIALTLAGAVSADYFSEGWKPGQPVVKGQSGYTYQAQPTGGAGSGAQETSAPGKSLSSFFSLESLLESGPMQALFGSAGVNITEKLQAARAQASLWDERIPLITDDNYEGMIVEEKFESLEEEKNRVWFIIISLSAAQKEGVHRYVDEQFDTAFNLTQEAGDLPHVRWGRIDYMNVTKITTKWNVWRAPFLVVLKDRGQTLRFYRPGTIRVQAEILREFLKRDVWEKTEPWRSPFGPGGSREFVMDYFANALTKVYDMAIRIPRWLLLLISGSLASFLVNVMHNSKWLWSSSNPTPKAPPKAAQASTSAPSEATSAPTQSTASGSKTAKGSATKRKGGKK